MNPFEARLESAIYKGLGLVTEHGLAFPQTFCKPYSFACKTNGANHSVTGLSPFLFRNIACGLHLRCIQARVFGRLPVCQHSVKLATL